MLITYLHVYDLYIFNTSLLCNHKLDWTVLAETNKSELVFKVLQKKELINQKTFPSSGSTLLKVHEQLSIELTDEKGSIKSELSWLY